MSIRSTTGGGDNNNNDCGDSVDDAPCHPMKPPTYLSLGCVIFPVFVLLWYRHSKQKCCRIFGKDGESKSSCMENHFEMMDRAGDGTDTGVLTNRFVKWINRNNVLARLEEYEVEIGRICRNTDIGIRNKTWTVENDNKNNNDDDKNTISDTDRLGYFCGVDDRYSGDEDNDDAGLFWECIPNPYRDPFELCYPKKTANALQNRDNAGVARALVASIGSSSDSSDEITARTDNTDSN